MPSGGSGFGGRGQPREGGRVNSAVRGAGLIGLAVILGIVLLQVVDKGPSGGGTPASSKSGTTTTTAAPPGLSQPGTTAAGGAARPRGEVRVAVLNGSGAPGAAMNTTNKLRLQGYQLAQPADSTPRTGTVVACRQGFDKEAAQLQADVGAPAAVEPFPASAPPGTENVNCIVVLGR